MTSKLINWSSSRQHFHILRCLLRRISYCFWSWHPKSYKLITNALDPIPIWLLKQCQDQLAPVLTTSVHASSSCAEFPTKVQHRASTPTCAKWPPLTGGQRGRGHFVLLDVNTVFDTIGHQNLLNVLSQSLGIRGIALKWFESYLKDPTQTDPNGSYASTSVTLKYGLPQGSVLGPILFTIYTPPSEIFANVVWTFIFTLVIFNWIYHSSQVQLSQKRQQYVVLRPVSRLKEMDDRQPL